MNHATHDITPRGNVLKVSNRDQEQSALNANERRRLANLFFELALHRHYSTIKPPTLAQAKRMLVEAYRCADRFLASQGPISNRGTGRKTS